MRAIALALQIVLAITCCAQYVYADSLADYVRAQMRKRHIVAISLAVVEGGKVIRAQAFGYTDRDGRTAVSPDSLFQAGSISKSVSALAALHLVEQGKLSLDADVNTELKSWKLPDNEYTKEHRVTLRELLSHTAGITVHGFSGYSVNSPLPTLTQVLDGVMPANTPPIRVEAVPGSRWNYSGGGYTIVQQMVVDATGQPYAKFLQDTVLRPLGMTNSSFDQPLPASEAAMAVTGYYPDGQAVAGRFHVYPEMAAAGLWTTATDLARYAIGVQRAIAGESTGVISKETAARMITEVKAGDGLGVFLEGSGDELRFTHSGRNEGFDAVFVAYAHGGRGAAVMLSANENSGMADRILQVIAKQYGWPGYPTLAVSTHHAAPLAAAALKPAAGYYDFPQNQTSTFTVQNGAIQAAVDGALLDEFKPESDRVFFSDDLNATLTLDRA
ncbi:MAG TPA: serine hydrolase domain-containing protein, partial [Chthonomonadales bacterium]|nr:serine hydrolase domain-containing protein [Chthonomonadales bacterium]